MFILPLLVFPLVFGLSVYRLCQIPRRLHAGELSLPTARCGVWLLAGVAAYVSLLIYTLILLASLIQVFVLGDNSEYFSLTVYVAGYPVVYFTAAWVFHYALVPGQKNV